MQLVMKQQNIAMGLGGGRKRADLGALWCNFTHDATMWPIHGEYQCGKCGRHYPVPWTEARSSNSSMGARA